jgi:acetyl/propionyl-CoA carboxylase alpha subunit
VQILADAAGGVIHLGERACSVQRRHQKLIEEAPAPGLDPDLRETMGRAAIAVARALGYCNAGTVEFLVSGDRFYFLEVNARIQVEHPVTEIVAGCDLVAAQLAIAGGAPLPVRQEDIRPTGCAIECRIGAEDPHNDFLPSVGRIDGVVEPAGPGIRVDSGLWAGQSVSRHFDPLLAKVIASGPTRAVASARTFPYFAKRWREATSVISSRVRWDRIVPMRTLNGSSVSAVIFASAVPSPIRGSAPR